MTTMDVTPGSVPQKKTDGKTRDTEQFALILLAYLSGWGVLTLLFGVPGFIYPALLSVLLMFVAIVLISRG